MDQATEKEKEILSEFKEENHISSLREDDESIKIMELSQILIKI